MFAERDPNEIIEILDSSPEKDRPNAEVPEHRAKIRKIRDKREEEVKPPEKVPEAIVAAMLGNDKYERVFLLKYKDIEDLELITELEARTNHPVLLIKYYEKRLVIPPDSDDDSETFEDEHD